MVIKCRLCSSDFALISLFNGKHRKNRDYIRKLVEITTGIKFQRGDALKYICYPCTTEIYNIYIFRIRSLENEEILQTEIKNNKIKSTSESDILDLNDVILPDMNELQNDLMLWLHSKQSSFEEVNNQSCEENISRNPSNHKEDTTKTSENSTQSDAVQNSDACIQCCIVKKTCQKGIQSDKISCCNKHTQCIVFNTNIHTQTNGIITKSSKVQCSLLGDTIKESSRKGNMDSTTQTQFEIATRPFCFDLNSKRSGGMNCTGQIQSLDVKCEALSPLPLPESGSVNGVVPVTPSKKPIVPMNSNISPTLNLLTVVKKSQQVLICSECTQTFYSKHSFRLHKKVHLVCNFCKQKFPRIKRAKWHMENECHAQKPVKLELVVELIPMEKSNDILEKYPMCMEDMKSGVKDENTVVRSSMRMRSRSISSLDSFSSSCNCCGLCQNSLSVLRGLTLGVTKAVQTNFFVDQWMTLDFFSVTNPLPKLKKISLEGNLNETLPMKKRKLSQSWLD